MEYAVIMAGGAGTRLWPLSRRKKPKQVLKLLRGKTLLRKCFERLTPLFDIRNILVLTNAAYLDLVRENLTELPPENVIPEPVIRDTAGAVALAAAVLTKADPNANMVVLTADHIIEPPQTLHQALKDALTFVRKNPQSLITFGIKPDYPSTQLGYIRLSEPQACPECENQIHRVSDFREKPDPDTAKKYFEDPSFYWNSGMFVWKAKTILDNIYNFLPETRQPLERIKETWAGPSQQATLNEVFTKLPKISIDYAVMEKAPNVCAIKLHCRWLDLGAFTALADFITSDHNNNILVADTNHLLDCKNSIIVTEETSHMLAAIGLHDTIIAHTPDATLVCPINQAHRLKELLAQLEEAGQEKYL